LSETSHQLWIEG